MSRVQGKIYAQRTEISFVMYYRRGVARTVYHILFYGTLLGVLTEFKCHRTGDIVEEHFCGLPRNR